MNIEFLKKKFSEYYSKNKNILLPKKFRNREFAFVFFNRTGFIRHKAFLDENEIYEFLSYNPPSDAYYSAAYYENPDIPDMNKKNWLGCDLIFDIDADHIPTKCKEEHDTWICKKCGNAGYGARPQKCPKCNSTDFVETTWICEECLNAAKEELTKLIEEFLVPDFGFDYNEIKLFFSGNRGYHVHIESEYLLDLDSSARREIVDYIKGIGLDPRFHGVTITHVPGGKIIAGPKLTSTGWRGKIARGILKFLEELDEDKIDSLKELTKRKRNLILRNKEKIIDGLLRVQKTDDLGDKVSWDVIKGINLKMWHILAKKAVSLISSKIDEPVTTDIHRLIRLPGSLHGKTGFIVKKINSLAELNKFDPFKDALAFEGNIEVYVKQSNKFRIRDEIYGPFYQEKVELPTSAAIFLMCKGLATVLEE